jgi:TolA-binding protein
MAKASQKDILSRVQDLGEEALQKLSEVPGGSRLVDMANQTKTRLDDLQKRVRGLEGLEQRVARLEQQMAAQTKTTSEIGSSEQTESSAQSKPSARSKSTEPAAKDATSSSSATKTPAAEKPAAPKKPPA